MKKVLLFSFLLLSLTALAHPGHGDHGDSGYTIIHYFTQPVHAIISVAVLAIVIFGVTKLFSKKGKSRNA